MPHSAKLHTSRRARWNALNPLRNLLLGLGLAGLGAPALQAGAGTMSGLTSDAEIRNSSGVSTITNLSTTTANIGSHGAPLACVVHVYQIPSAVLNSSEQFTSANLTVKMSMGSTMTINGDLYGVGFGASSAVSTADFYNGTLDTGNTLIKDNFLLPSTPAYATVSYNGSSLVDYLNDVLYSARSGGLTSAYVFFRINTDGVNWGNRYQICMADAGANAPKLDYTTAAASGWDQVPLGGGGYVTGIVSSPTGAEIYCRTDVGGAFRWDAVNSEWIPIGDRVVPYATGGATDTMSVPSLVVDPSDANRLYMAVGGATYSSLKGIYTSPDKGATWTAINNSIAQEGNGSGRSFGERLAVDPNNPNVVWYGSIQEGLFKGTKSGSTWSWAQIPAASVPFGTNKVGVPFVICDKNGTSTITYAGVFDSGGAGGLYRSTDGGSTWAKVGGTAILQPGRAAVATDGTLYVAGYSTVVKMARGGTLSAVVPGPSNISYRGIAVAPGNADLVFVAESSSGSQYGRIWRSANGGTSWSQQQTNLNGGNTARTEPDGTPTLTGYWFGATSALMLNPANTNELWAGDFFGVARTQDAQNLGTSTGATWRMLQKNQEETVVQILKTAPTGAKLMMGVSDVGGCRYLNTAMRPYGTFGNTFRGPSGGSSTSLDFSEANHSVWARGWVNGPANGGSGATSSDGGVNWLPFGQIAHKTVTNSSSAGPETFEMSTYISKQRAKGVTTVSLVVASGNTPGYSTSMLSFDSREAADTNVRPKLILNGSTTLNPIADSYVSGGATGTNYGTDATIGTAYAYGTAAYSKWAVLKFDISSVSTITSATLQLNRRSSTNTLAYPTGIFATANSSWTETGVTWANRPAPVGGGGDPVGDPRYYDGSTALLGGRVAVSATDPDNMVWLSLGSGVAPRYSTDRGVTWTVSTGTGMPTSQMVSNFNPSTFITQLASDRVNGNFYLARFGGTSHAIYRSTDGGATWSSIGSVNANAYNVYRAQIVTAPAANDVWLCDDGVSGSANGGLWRSTNGGANWTKITGVTAVRQASFGKAASGSGYTVFMHGFKAAVKGIYRSDDYGATWVALDTPPTNSDIHTVAGDRQVYGKVYIGTGGRGAFQGE